MFNLPKSTTVNKFIPKNTFDSYTNAKQKKLIAEKISRITWNNKISFDTANLRGSSIEEIQLFEIVLKEQCDIQSILSIIEKSIPYTIIFVMKFGDSSYFSTSVKHINPHNTDNAVIDYTFISNWFLNGEHTFKLNLKNDLDWVYKEFCEQFASITSASKNLQELIVKQKSKDTLEKEIDNLKASISRSKQFNKKVDLNLKLKNLERNLVIKDNAD